MNLLEVEFSIHDDPILCFLPREIVYYSHPEKTLIKKMIIIDAENQIKHKWFFYRNQNLRNQVLRSYQKYSLKHQKLISEKIYYGSGQMKRYTEYDVVNGGFFYTENYDREGLLNKTIGERHVEK